MLLLGWKVAKFTQPLTVPREARARVQQRKHRTASEPDVVNLARQPSFSAEVILGGSNRRWV